MAKCEWCLGSGDIEDANGYTVPCRFCNGTGTAPDATNCGNCYRCLDGANDHRGWPVLGTRMIVCPDCGNKRCPKATDCQNACTGSNEPGQPGSRYGTAPDATAPAGTPEAQYNELTAIATGRLPAPQAPAALAAKYSVALVEDNGDDAPSVYDIETPDGDTLSIDEAAALLTQQAEQIAKLRTLAASRIDTPADQPNWSTGRIAGYNQAVDIVRDIIGTEGGEA